MSDQPTKNCATCDRALPLVEFGGAGRHRSCRDCAGKARRAKAAEKPGAAEKRARRPRLEYTPELGDLVCSRIAEGETISEIAATPGCPTAADVARWRANVDEFALAYALARDTRADIRVDGIAKAVKDMRAGSLDPNLGKAICGELRWLASKDSPRYADKITVDQTIRPGQAEPESEDVTRDWIKRIVAKAAVTSATNVIELKPVQDKDDAA
jgi:terminase small subunit-like protein